jgi:hypothetical protein
LEFIDVEAATRLIVIVALKFAIDGVTVWLQSPLGQSRSRRISRRGEVTG